MKTILKKRVFTLCVFALAGLTAACNPKISEPETVDLAIRNVDVFDSKTGTVNSNKTILIKGEAIHAIVDADDPVSAIKDIDGNDRIVTPGFIDTHAHLMVMFGEKSYDPDFTPSLDQIDKLADQYLQYGTTTIMDMGQAKSWLETSLHWQENPAPNFPNVFVAGESLISEIDGIVPSHWAPITSDSIKEKLAGYKSQGIDRIKLYRKLEAPDMQAVIKAANELDMRYYAHTDNNVVTIPEAMDFGVRDFEHFFTVIPSALSYRKEMRVMFEGLGLDGINTTDEYSASLVLMFNYIDSNPEFKRSLTSVFDQMAAQDVTISTALNILASAASRASFYCTFEPIDGQSTPVLGYNSEQIEKLDQSYDVMMKYTKLAHDKGVKLRIGTDCWYGGQALLSELMLLREAEFSPEDTLQIATWNGAEALGLEDQLGHIAPNKKADLIIFEKSPLENPENLLAEKVVIKGGKIYKP